MNQGEKQYPILNMNMKRSSHLEVEN